jgi:hypothetical protein
VDPAAAIFPATGPSSVIPTIDTKAASAMKVVKK